MNSKPPDGIDDFKLITGIGPAIERRLHEAGIATFAQLSTLSPVELAEHLQGLAGMSARRIEEQEWLLQARELADLAPLGATSREESSGNGQHYATFTIEFLLEQDNEVRRTRVVHIQDDKQDTWAGWESERLLTFIREQAAIRPSARQETTPARVLDRETAPDMPDASEQVPLAGTPQLLRFQITSRESAVRGLVNHEDPFSVHFELDLADVTRPRDQALRYEANMHAKQLGTGSRQTVGPLRGQVPPTGQLVVDFPNVKLASGAYRLQAEISLSTPENAMLNTLVDGELLRVY